MKTQTIKIRHARARQLLAQRIKHLRKELRTSVKMLNEGSPMAGYFVVIYTESLAKLKASSKSYGSYEHIRNL